jgi:hypothetical protein
MPFVVKKPLRTLRLRKRRIDNRQIDNRQKKISESVAKKLDEEIIDE